MTLPSGPDRRTASVLALLLFVYLIGRVLQLFVGTVPNILIVILQVVPAALFALVHGWRLYRPRGILVFSLLCLGIGSAAESLSLRTGIPFGHYTFTDLMGPKILGLPILLALAYLGMGYVSWVVASLILRSDERGLSGSRVLWVPALASFLMLAWDLSMDAVWANVDRAWIWLDGGAYFGVPPSNFIGWFLTAYLYYQLFALYVRDRAVESRPASFWRFPVVFYVACALGNLLTVAPAFLPHTMVDPSGRPWRLADIIWASRLISVFAMLPFGLAGWVATDKSKGAMDVAPCLKADG